MHAFAIPICNINLKLAKPVSQTQSTNTKFRKEVQVYMIDVFADPTGREVGNQSKGGGIVHILQVKQNKAIRAVMGINPKECIGKEELLKCSKLTGLDEMSLVPTTCLPGGFSPLRETLPT
jgi:hypothetical protein